MTTCSWTNSFESVPSAWFHIPSHITQDHEDNNCLEIGLELKAVLMLLNSSIDPSLTRSRTLLNHHGLLSYICSEAL